MAFPRKRNFGEMDQPLAKKRCTRSLHEQECFSIGLLEELSPNLLCNILGFLGPTSQSLVSLSMVNNHFRKNMESIGQAMLPRAQIHFSMPLHRKSKTESSLSLFIRHSRLCSKILSDLANLREVLSRNPENIRPVDVESALTIALELLQVSPALSVPLEKTVLSNAGKCGGKVFKYSKWMLSKCGLAMAKDHKQHLEVSRTIMQTVVSKELQRSPERIPISINAFVQKQIGSKHWQTTGCF